jgi:hypothetical protein
VIILIELHGIQAKNKRTSLYSEMSSMFNSIRVGGRRRAIVAAHLMFHQGCRLESGNDGTNDDQLKLRCRLMSGK